MKSEWNDLQIPKTIFYSQQNMENLQKPGKFTILRTILAHLELDGSHMSQKCWDWGNERLEL